MYTEAGVCYWGQAVVTVAHFEELLCWMVCVQTCAQTNAENTQYARHLRLSVSS